MSKLERKRDELSEIPEETYWEERTSAGWRLAAVEWEREIDGIDGSAYTEEVPYGLQVTGDCRSLEENPLEMQVLALMMDGIVDDQPMSAVAEELNRRGIRTRSGKPWTRTTVFRMLPRLIEAGPRIFSRDEWRQRKRRLLRAV
jgi:hypothetical protein